jgi:hypothetical protein
MWHGSHKACILRRLGNRLNSLRRKSFSYITEGSRGQIGSPQYPGQIQSCAIPHIFEKLISVWLLDCAPRSKTGFDTLSGESAMAVALA